jgi:hypothetical protein
MKKIMFLLFAFVLAFLATGCSFLLVVPDSAYENENSVIVEEQAPVYLPENYYYNSYPHYIHNCRYTVRNYGQYRHWRR